jgi:hypothetical protein
MAPAAAATSPCFKELNACSWPILDDVDFDAIITTSTQLAVSFDNRLNFLQVPIGNNVYFKNQY